MKKILVYVVLVAVLAGVGWFYFMHSDTEKNVVESEEVSYNFKAIDLFNKYAESQELADRQFLNKVIQVEGRVAEIEHDSMGDRILVLKEEGDIFGIVCTLDESNKGNQGHAATLKAGDYVVLKGVCIGFDVEVKMNQCVIIANKNAVENI